MADQPMSEKSPDTAEKIAQVELKFLERKYWMQPVSIIGGVGMLFFVAFTTLHPLIKEATEWSKAQNKANTERLELEKKRIESQRNYLERVIHEKNSDSEDKMQLFYQDRADRLQMISQLENLLMNQQELREYITEIEKVQSEANQHQIGLINSLSSSSVEAVCGLIDRLEVSMRLDIQRNQRVWSRALNLMPQPSKNLSHSSFLLSSNGHLLIDNHWYAFIYDMKGTLLKTIDPKDGSWITSISELRDYYIFTASPKRREQIIFLDKNTLQKQEGVPRVRLSTKIATRQLFQSGENVYANITDTLEETRFVEKVRLKKHGNKLHVMGSKDRFFKDYKSEDPYVFRIGERFLVPVKGSNDIALMKPRTPMIYIYSENLELKRAIPIFLENFKQIYIEDLTSIKQSDELVRITKVLTFQNHFFIFYAIPQNDSSSFNLHLQIVNKDGQNLGASHTWKNGYACGIYKGLLYIITFDRTQLPEGNPEFTMCIQEIDPLYQNIAHEKSLLPNPR